MRLINETSSEAELVRVIRDEQSMAAAVVVKSTYQIERGRCSLSRRQQAVLTKPKTIAGATFEPETVLTKAGVDILVIGMAQALVAGTRMAAVGVRVGQWARQLAVFGDRVWRRRAWCWSASDPDPFTEIPVNWANAFGGVARCKGAPVPHSGNPHGKGYAIDLDQLIEGEALPNIEDPEGLLEQPGQLVNAASFEPLPASSALRVEPALNEERLTGVDKSIYNVAHSHHRIAELSGGERCELTGWTGMPGTSFELPAELFSLEVGVDGRVHEFWPQIDTMCVLPTTQELIVTQRATFTYRYARNAPRVARLRKVAGACHGD